VGLPYTYNSVRLPAYRRRLTLPLPISIPIAESRFATKITYIPSYTHIRDRGEDNFREPADLLPGAGKIPALGGFLTQQKYPKPIHDWCGRNETNGETHTSTRTRPRECRRDQLRTLSPNWCEGKEADWQTLCSVLRSLASHQECTTRGLLWRDWFEGTHLLRWVRLLGRDWCTFMLWIWLNRVWSK